MNNTELTLKIAEYHKAAKAVYGKSFDEQIQKYINMLNHRVLFTKEKKGFIKAAIDIIKFQETIGLDVSVPIFAAVMEIAIRETAERNKKTAISTKNKKA